MWLFSFWLAQHFRTNQFSTSQELNQNHWRLLRKRSPALGVRFKCFENWLVHSLVSLYCDCQRYFIDFGSTHSAKNRFTNPKLSTYIKNINIRKPESNCTRPFRTYFTEFSNRQLVWIRRKIHLCFVQELLCGLTITLVVHVSTSKVISAHTFLIIHTCTCDCNNKDNAMTLPWPKHLCVVLVTRPSLKPGSEWYPLSC